MVTESLCYSWIILWAQSKYIPCLHFFFILYKVSPQDLTKFGSLGRTRFYWNAVFFKLNIKYIFYILIILFFKQNNMFFNFVDCSKVEKTRTLQKHWLLVVTTPPMKWTTRGTTYRCMISFRNYLVLLPKILHEFWIEEYHWII